jgi:hypothetical protein
MKREEIIEYNSYLYEKECSCCGIKQEILTQRHNFPEYETEVYLKCQCGEYIEFILPVN